MGRAEEAMGNPSWAEEHRYDTVQERWQIRPSWTGKIAEWTAPQDDKELLRSLQAQGVRAGAVLTGADLVEDPHLRQRGFIQEIERAGGRRAFAGRPFRIPGISMAIRHVPRWESTTNRCCARCGTLRGGDPRAGSGRRDLDRPRPKKRRRRTQGRG
jgi:crotonobetainyl-CoA:carnitine CoA-transferase CaiB-like acyl-CoA transferase